MMEVRRNHRELMTESKRTRDSAIRFYREKVGGVGWSKGRMRDVPDCALPAVLGHIR